MFTDADAAMLKFENRAWSSSGRKDSCIREEFHLTATRYYQRLNALLDNPDAAAAEPMTINRLRRVRARLRGRSVGE